MKLKLPENKELMERLEFVLKESKECLPPTNNELRTLLGAITSMYYHTGIAMMRNAFENPKYERKLRMAMKVVAEARETAVAASRIPVDGNSEPESNPKLKLDSGLTLDEEEINPGNRDRFL